MHNTFQQKTLYIRDLQYTRNTVVVKDCAYNEINPRKKNCKKDVSLQKYNKQGLKEGDSFHRKKTQFLK